MKWAHCSPASIAWWPDWRTHRAPIVAAPIHFEIAAPTLAVTARTDKTTYKVGEEVKINVPSPIA
jgi:hypothetical protein